MICVVRHCSLCSVLPRVCNNLTASRIGWLRASLGRKKSEAVVVSLPQYSSLCVNILAAEFFAEVLLLIACPQKVTFLSSVFLNALKVSWYSDNPIAYLQMLV